MLVVGGTTTALVLATLLAHRGTRTALAYRGPDSPGTDGAVALALAAPEVLGRLGIGDGPAGVLTGFDHVGVDGEPAPAGDRSGGVYADGHRLRDRLRAAVPGSVSWHDGLDRLHQDDGVTVRFRSGDSERFDLVVGADGHGSFLRTAAGVSPASERGVDLHEWTLRVDRPPARTTAPREFWSTDAVATAIPLGDTVWARVGSRADPEGDQRPRERALGTLGRLDGRLRPPPDGEPSPASYQRLPAPDVDPTWRKRRVALCGAAATPLGALSGLVPSLGIEDAAVLAAAVDEHGPTEAALDQYTTHRRRRLAAVRGAAEGSAPPHAGTDDPIGRLAAVRGVVLGGFPDRGATAPPSPGGGWSAEGED